MAQRLPGAADEPRRRGRVRPLPDAARDLRRGRLRLAAGVHVALRPAVARAAARDPVDAARAVGVPPRARPPDDAAVRRAARRRRASRGCSTRSARTRCSASRPTTRTGSATTPPRRMPPLADGPALRAILAGNARRLYRLGGATRWRTADARRRREPLIDCDVHNALPADDALRRTCRRTGASGATRLDYLPTAFREVRENLGDRSYIGAEYPRPTPRASRVDAWPPGGGPPASDLAFTRSSCSTRWDVETAVLQPAARRSARC